jgi:hypothetical protein
MILRAIPHHKPDADSPYCSDLNCEFCKELQNSKTMEEQSKKG